MKTEIEDIIYNYADELKNWRDKVKAKYCIFSLGLLINHIQIYRRGLSVSSKRVYLFGKKVDLFN